MFNSTLTHTTSRIQAQARSSLAIAVGLVMAASLLASPAADAAGPRPNFQLPFACGQTWEASTYRDNPATTDENEGHGGDEANSNSIDLTQFQTSGDPDSNISQGEPVLASAAGTVENKMFTSNFGNRVDIDHGNGWKTHYLHLEQEAPVENGDHVAQGERIGRVGKTGTKDTHLHYTQMRDGNAVRVAFNGTQIATHRDNEGSFGPSGWGGLWGSGNAEKLTSLNCPMNSFVQFTQYGMNYQLVYKPGTGATKILRQSSDGKGLGATTYSSTWSKRWTHFTPFSVDGKPHYFAYKSSTGEVDFDRIKPFGAGATTVGEGTWDKGWTHFVPFVLDGRTYFVAYDSTDGVATTARINADGRGATTTWSGSWGEGWTAFVPFAINGQPHLLSYKGSTGQALIHRIAAGGMTQIWSGTLGSNWSQLVPRTVAGTPQLLAYRDDGTVRTMRIKAGGLGVETLNTSQTLTGWTTFSPFVIAGKAHYLLYNARTGSVAAHKVNTTGIGASLIWTGSWSPGWA